MELLLKVIALAVLTALVSKPIQKSSPELALVLVIAALLFGGVILLAAAQETVDFVRELSSLTGLAPEIFSPLLKTIAIALTVRFASAFCRDASHETMGKLVETVGVLCALVAALPLLRALTDLLVEFI